MLEEDKPYYSGVKQVRWLASRYRAVVAVEKHLRITVGHLENAAASGEATAKGLLNKLKNQKFVHFLYFMLDLMKLMSTLSQRLQADSLLVTDVSHDIDETVLKLLALKSTSGEAESRFVQNFDKDSNLLTHGNGTILLNSGSTRPVRGAHDQPADDISALKMNIIDKAVEYIEKRFEAFDKPPLTHFKAFDCRQWPSERSALAVYGDEAISCISEHYSDLLTDQEKSDGTLKGEWCALKSRLREPATQMRTSQDVLKSYSAILRVAPDNLANISTLVKIMMTISSSTAIVERGFSALNRIKTPQRATMSQECLQNLLMVSLNTAEVGEFDADTRIVHNWMSSGKGTKHVHGHKLPEKK